MWRHAWKNTLAISSILAAGGILSCLGALLEIFMPKGSPVAFLGTMILLGLAVAAVLVGFAWVCEKFEGHFDGRPDRLPSRSKLNGNDAVDPRAAMRSRSAESKIVRGTRPPPDAPQLFSRGQYVSTFRGSIAPKNAGNRTATRTWHGQ